MLIVSVIVPVCAVFLGFRILWRNQSSNWSLLLLQACLASGWALGASSCAYFVWLVLIGPPDFIFVVIELACLIGLLVPLFLVLHSRHQRKGTEVPAWHWTATVFSCILWAALALSLTLAVKTFLWLYLLAPHGSWDATALWNNRARHLFRGGDRWRDSFSDNYIGNSDYPLLVPAAVARCWTYVNGRPTTAPGLIAGLFAFATIGTLASSLAVLRSPSHGLIAGLVLLASQPFLLLATWQYADVPLSFFFLATTALFRLHDQSGVQGSRYPAVAGSTAGYAAWTKNEGLLFALAVLLARLVTVSPTRGWRASGRELGSYLLGLLPIGLLLLYFKTQVAPSTYRISVLFPPESPARVTDLSRYATIAKGFANELTTTWAHMGALLVLYFGLLGMPPRHKRKPGAACVFLILALMFSGYFIIYLTTSPDLTWHLQTSLDRLLIQLWPHALFGFFLLAATPEEAWEKRRPISVSPDSERPGESSTRPSGPGEAKQRT